MAGILDAFNSPMMGLAAGLLSGGAPGGTFGGGLSQGLQNMMGMQQQATTQSLLAAKIKEMEDERKRRDMQRGAFQGLLGTQGTPNTPYQMSEAEMFPGEAPIPGLLNAGQAPTGMYAQDPGMAGLLNTLGPDVGTEFLAKAALEKMKGADPTANMQDYQFLISQGYTPEQAMERVFKQTNGGADPYYQFLPIVNPDGTPGYAVGNARTGGMNVGTIGGQTVAPAQYSPELQGKIAGAKSGAEVSAKDAAQRAIDLPKVVAEGSYAIKLLDDLERHPGLSMAVGTSSAVPVIPGTKQADFVTRLDQIQGQQFLQAYQTLKGGGQITEVEGKKAEQAMGRLNRAQTEEEFKSSLRELRGVISTGIDRAARGITVSQKNAPEQQRVRKFNPQTGMIE